MTFTFAKVSVHSSVRRGSRAVESEESYSRDILQIDRIFLFIRETGDHDGELSCFEGIVDNCRMSTERKHYDKTGNPTSKRSRKNVQFGDHCARRPETLRQNTSPTSALHSAPMPFFGPFHGAALPLVLCASASMSSKSTSSNK